MLVVWANDGRLEVQRRTLISAPDRERTFNSAISAELFVAVASQQAQKNAHSPSLGMQVAGCARAQTDGLACDGAVPGQLCGDTACRAQGFTSHGVGGADAAHLLIGLVEHLYE